MDESRSMLIIGLFQDAGKKIDQTNLRKSKKKTFIKRIRDLNYFRFVNRRLKV